MSHLVPRHQFWIDRGGTFTDCLHRDRVSGALRVVKVLSSDEAPLVGIRQLLALGPDEPIPTAEIRMGTTLATNALLERRGCPCVLIADRGLGDLTRIGDQTRPELFALDIEKPEILPDWVVEVDARMNADGHITNALDGETLRRALEHARAEGAESVAIALMHAYRKGDLEQRVAEIASQVGFDHVSTSHRISNELGLLGRTDTTTANAYLTPLLTRYMDKLEQHLGTGRLRMMQSNGGLVDASRFIGRNAVLSGPAAGVVATGAVADELGLDEVIGFDMGGTSTDVSRYGGEVTRVFETQIAGVRIRAPMIELHTVAAGGGSICTLEGQRMTVGPESAGANPGPLCYGQPEAEDLTLTDVSLCLGRIAPDRFPFALDDTRARVKLQEAADALTSQGVAKNPTEVARGFLRIAVENMVAAIQKVSVGRGHDVRTHGMIVFGGAGGQYACLVARRLGIRSLVFHPYAGVLSAFGMGVANFEWHGERDAGRVDLETVPVSGWEDAFQELETAGRAALARDAGADPHWTFGRQVALRYRGTETALTVESADPAEMRRAFETKHRREFGYTRPNHPIEAATLRVRVELSGQKPSLPRVEPGSGQPERTAALWSGGAMVEAPVYKRENFPLDTEVPGPALVLDETGTVVIEDGFVGARDSRDYLILRDTETRGVDEAAHTRVDPVLLEVFNNQFKSIAEQMGVVLQRTAMSTNIRDRLDFSCAVFDADGGLVANAPHIPVHLGAMGESVRAVRAAHPDTRPGDVYVTNDPAAGGSHLPDITVVTPVHDEAGRLQFVVASRGHHADVGGLTPGSMPPFSTRLDEEGVVFRSLKIVESGKLDEALLMEVLTTGAHPARRPDENLADLQAQIAANEKGVQLLADLLDRYGLNVVAAYMQHIQDNAADLTARAIEEIDDGVHAFEDQLDDGTRIAVRVTVRGGSMEIDFDGTDPAADNNLNTPKAVTVAAVLYVLRVLVGKPIPLNSGCLRPVTIRIPEGSLLAPEPWRAVAAGNVETSQRIVDVLFGALGLAAASQGTMNNLTFGDDHLAYYETLGGGAGGTPNRAGASGVHTHMTNSKCTDPEVLETRFPVRIRRFQLREGSGGKGAHPGGEGLIREIEFLAPMRVSVLSERRVVRPYGMRGGGHGAAGMNLLNGTKLPHRVSIEVSEGDVLRIETPGGGGWGEPE
ncbi:MAG: hydantoinase B/oxoprolinase family protein [Deltaproteobacteria bacterium]|nr:hydantoinase B/oxoprolinase family protein [Deltaproteobacteria bacterium]